MMREKQLFWCIYLLYPCLVLLERNLSAKKMTQNWYDKARSGTIRNVCTFSIFLPLDLWLKKIPTTWKDLKHQAVTRCSSLYICWLATSVRSGAYPGRAGGKNPLRCSLQKIQDSMAAPVSFKTSPIIPFLFPAPTWQSLHDLACCV